MGHVPPFPPLIVEEGVGYIFTCFHSGYPKFANPWYCATIYCVIRRNTVGEKRKMYCVIKYSNIQPNQQWQKRLIVIIWNAATEFALFYHFSLLRSFPVFVFFIFRRPWLSKFHLSIVSPVLKQFLQCDVGRLEG